MSRRALASLDQRLAEHDAAAPIGTGMVRHAWANERQRLRDAIRHRDAKRQPDVQERNFPTVEVAVDLPEGVRRIRRNLTRARQSEAWRHTRLDALQVQAQAEMETAWRSVAGPLARLVGRYGLLSGGSVNLLDLFAHAQQTLRDWMTESRRRRLRVEVVLDCLLEPLTLPEIEKRRRLKPGDALEIYQAGLDLWSELRGWLRPR
jgi:hypothetical protein